MDVFRTTDGELFIFHDGTEGYMLGKNCSVKEMTAKEVREQRLINKTGSRLEHGIETLDAVLEQFKDRCLINLDRCWWCWPDVFAAVKRHGMKDQIIFKSAPEKQYLDCIEAWEKPLMYMPIIWNEEEYQRAAARNLNIVAVVHGLEGRFTGSSAGIHRNSPEKRHSRHGQCPDSGKSSLRSGNL